MSFYGTLSEADAYHADRGNSTWTGDNADKEVALLRGSEYIDQAFRSSFPGLKTGLRSQTREWPRSWAVDVEGNAIPSDEVPIEVEHASYEAALRELTDPGSLLPDYDPANQFKRSKVDVIEVEYAAPFGPGSVKPVITAIAAILQPILTGGSFSSVAGRSHRI